MCTLTHKESINRLFRREEDTKLATKRSRHRRKGNLSKSFFSQGEPNQSRNSLSYQNLNPGPKTPKTITQDRIVHIANSSNTNKYMKTTK